MYLVAIIDETKCIGCKTCVIICPEPNAIAYLAKKKKSFVISEKCKGCGICQSKCSKEAIFLKQIAFEFTEDELCPSTGPFAV